MPLLLRKQSFLYGFAFLRDGANPREGLSELQNDTLYCPVPLWMYDSPIINLVRPHEIYSIEVDNYEIQKRIR